MSSIADPDALMRLVKSRAAAYRALDASGSLVLPDPLDPLTRPIPVSDVPRHPSVNIQELLALEGPDFVRSAYQRILWRNAQPEEVSWRSDLLRSGSLAPVVMIHDLSTSAEGRQCNVLIHGLEQRWRFCIGRRRKVVKAWRLILTKLGIPSLRVAAHRWMVEQRNRTDRHEAALKGLLGPTVDQDPAGAAAILRRRVASLESRIAELERRVVVAP